MSKPALPPDVAQIIEESIVQMADAMRKMNSTRLSRKALVVLLMHDTKLGMGTVEAVLDSLDGLEQTWLKKRSTADMLYGDKKSEVKRKNENH